MGQTFEEEASQVTAWLRRATEGDPTARERAYQLVREQLKRIVKTKMSRAEFRQCSLTEIADDAFLKLINLDNVEWQDRLHFLKFACSVVRQLLVDHARGRNSLKRGGGRQPVELDVAAEPGEREPLGDVLAVNDALEKLAAVRPELAEVVELHHFGGYSIKVIANELLHISEHVVRRRWNDARTLLYDWLRDE